MADDTAELDLLTRPDFDELIANADRYFQESKPALSEEELLLRDPDFDNLLKAAEAYLSSPTAVTEPQKNRFKFPKIKLPTIKRPSISRQQGHNLARAGAAGVIATAATLTPQVQPPQFNLPDIGAYQPLSRQIVPATKQLVGQISENVPRWEWGKEPVKTAETAPQVTVLDEMIKPMVEEVQKRRAERAQEDPEYSHRVDKELNQDRINFLLFFTGKFLRRDLETTTNSANQIISFNTKTKTVDLISITGDVMGPEVEQYAKSKGQPAKRYSINNSFDVGRGLGGSEEEGLKLMRKTFEDATGLSVDFEGVSSSGVVKDFIDQVFGGIDVDVPYDFFAYKVEIDGKEYPDHTFNKGQQKLSGAEVVQYIAADDYERHWAGRLHHHRKHIVLDTLRKELKGNLDSPVKKGLFGAKFLNFMKSQLDKDRISLDFEIGKAFNFGALADVTKPLGLDQVKEGKSVLIVDPVYEGEGVRMVKADAETNPRSKGELGKYPDLWWLQIPPNSDPDAKDLVKDFWGVTGGPREIIRNKLVGPALVASKPMAKELSLAEIRPSLPQLTLTPTPEEIKFQGDRGEVDSNSPIHWDGDKVYLFNSSLEGTTRYSGPDIEHLSEKGEKVTIDRKFNGGVWIEATYKDPKSGDLYGWYHHEPANILPSKTAAVDYLTTPKIGAMVSKDNGKNWHDLGFILENNEIDRETTNMYFAGGDGDFSVIPDREGEHLYFLYTSYDPEKSQQGIKVARTKTEDLAKPEGKLEQLNDGNPVIEAKSDIHQKGADFFWGPSVHFNKELGMYVILLNHAQNDSWDQEGIYTIYAKDLSDPKSWSAPQKIELPVGVSEWYPQVLGTDKGDTDKEVSQHPRLVIRGESNKEINFLKPQ